MDRIKRFSKTPEFTAVASALVMGYLTHHFALTNVMHNIDDIGNQPYGYGAGLSSGRWLLTLLGDSAQFLELNFNLPYVNGIVFLIFIAVSAGILISAFRMHRKVPAALLGMLLAVFPSATTALIYRFTSAYYGLAFLMAVFAGWVLWRHQWGVLFSAVLIACSLGIYQAYVSVTIGIFVLLLLQQVFEGKSVPALIRQGVQACTALILGLLLYFLCLKIALTAYGAVLSDYNGMNHMAGFAVGRIPSLVRKAFLDFCKFPLTNYCSLAGSKLIKIAYLLLGGVSAVQMVYLCAFRVKNVLRSAVACLLLLVLPVGVNFVEVMSPDAWMYTMMVYAFVLVPCVPLVLMEAVPEFRWRPIAVNILTVVTAVLICSYGYQANVNYAANYFINRQAENYVASIVTQVRMTEGFDADKKWALLGKIQDPLLDSPWEYELSNGGLFDTERTLNDVSQYYWFWTYVGYHLPTVDESEAEALKSTPEVKSMPCWPAEGSIKVIGDNVVLKFED